MDIEQIDLNKLKRTTDDVFSMTDLKLKLNHGRQLRIKFGADVTGPFLHIGHAVNLWMMRFFQDHGHKVIFLIGDFTTRIGDPTGKSEKRKEITREQMDINAQEFINQVGIVLKTDSDVFEVRRNSEWYDKMPLNEFMSLLSQVTHSKLIQRDMFQKRIHNNQEIHMHEMLYPVLQGYDSVMLESDMTIVGNDQMFNELLGRFYQGKHGQEPQIVITTKITPGTDGGEKQSKSIGNYIALTDTPRDKFGKTMSIPDRLIVPYMKVYTDIPEQKISIIETEISCAEKNPMDAKRVLAMAIVKKYHGIETAKSEDRWFMTVFSKKLNADDLPEIFVNNCQTLLEMLTKCLPGQSRSAIRRLAGQGGIRLNDMKQLSVDERVDFKNGDILKTGKKRLFRILLKLKFLQ